MLDANVTIFNGSFELCKSRETTAAQQSPVTTVWFQLHNTPGFVVTVDYIHVSHPALTFYLADTLILVVDSRKAIPFFRFSLLPFPAF